MTKKLTEQPNFYKVEGKMIPARLTIVERETFVRGLGVPRPQAAVFAMQDRAASMAAKLATLVELSGNEELIKKADEVLRTWNAECDEFFRVKS